MDFFSFLFFDLDFFLPSFSFSPLFSFSCSLLAHFFAFFFFFSPQQIRQTLLSRSRGIDGITARRVLVQSFGAEVTAALPGKDLRRRVDAAAGAALSKVKLEAAAAASEEEK